MGVLGVNHVAFRTPDPARLRAFYRDLLGAEELDGAHAPLRAGQTLLVFFDGDAPRSEDELAFDVDRAGFDAALERARGLGDVRGPVEHTPWSRGFYLRDPDGRRVEVTYDDRTVYWRE